MLGLQQSESRKNYWENVATAGSLKTMTAGSKTKSAFNKEKWLPLAQMPFLISHYCCNVMKKSPLKRYQTANGHIVPFIGTLAEESRMRKQAWIRHGCNSFEGNKQSSQPMSFWTEQDVLEYIDAFGIEIASVYGDVVKDETGLYSTTGLDRTGCVYCAYGLYLDKGESRFEKLKKISPKQYDYSIGGGEWADNPYYIEGLSTEPDEIGWVAWNPKKIWMPNEKGLGMGKVFDMVNEVYGEGFMRY